MKSKYTKIKYTNTGVKAPVVTCMKLSPELSRANIIELEYEEMIITIKRLTRKTMYTRSSSKIFIQSNDTDESYVAIVYDTINDARIVCENLYLIIKKPGLDFRITTGDYDNIYEYMKGVLYNAKES